MVCFSAPLTSSAQVTLCRTTFDCPTGRDLICDDVGSQAGGMGVCRTPQQAADAKPGVFDNPLEADSLMELLLTVIRGIVRIASIFLVLAFVFIGFQFAAAQGKPEAISKARNMLLWTAIGAAILLGAEGIAAIIDATARSLAP
jgi:hypothetical protein